LHVEPIFLIFQPPLPRKTSLLLPMICHLSISLSPPSLFCSPFRTLLRLQTCPCMASPFSNLTQRPIWLLVSNQWYHTQRDGGDCNTNKNINMIHPNNTNYLSVNDASNIPRALLYDEVGMG
jgi:hypothetical protein